MTDKKNFSEQDWKERLTPEQFEICRKKEPNCPSAASILILRPRAHTRVHVAGMPCFYPKRNLIPDADGQVFIIH